MSGIVGIFDREGQTPLPSLLRRMLAARPESGPDGEDCWSAAGIGLGRRHFWLTPQEWGEPQPLIAGELALCADARLDNRSDLGRLLGLDPEQLASTSDAALILRAYQTWGTDCLAHLLGDYAFLLWDGRRRELFAARDALGARSLCYVRLNGRGFVFASDIAHLLAHPDVRPTLNENRVAAYLADAFCPPEETFFDGILYLPPGHALVVSAEGERLWQHWEIDPAHSIRYRDEQAYADHYRELLTQAVGGRLRAVGPVAVSLSGGLDSTTIAALAAPMLSASGQIHSRLRSYSYSFDELESCDERRYITPVVESYGLEASYVACDDKWTLKDIDMWPTTPDYVLSDSFAWLPDAVMNAAGGGDCRALLGGYFGDVLMTGEHYWALDMMRGGRLGLLARTIVRHHAAINWRAGFVEFGFRRMVPEDFRGLYRRLRPRSIEASWPGIQEALVARTDLRDRLAPPLAPATMRAPGYWQRYQSLTHIGFSQGPAAVRYQYNRRGLELLLPYLDRRLVEFVMAVPAYVLGSPGDGRKLHRRAMAGRLPEAVRLRRDPTSFAPLLIKGVAEKEVDTIRRVMSDPEVVRRGYIRADWLDKQLQTGYEPSAESRLLLKAVYLELWLRRHWSAVA